MDSKPARPFDDSYRGKGAHHLALGLLILGLALIIAGVVLVILHQSPRDFAGAPAPRTPHSVSSVKKFQYGVLLLSVVIGAFALASYAFVRWSRHFRRWLLHQPPPPTPVEDVWAMHRLPEEGAEQPPGPQGPEQGQ